MDDDGAVFEELRGDAKFNTENTSFYLEDTEINHHLLGSFEQIRLNFMVGVVFYHSVHKDFTRWHTEVH